MGPRIETLVGGPRFLSSGGGAQLRNASRRLSNGAFSFSPAMPPLWPGFASPGLGRALRSSERRLDGEATRHSFPATRRGGHEPGAERSDDLGRDRPLVSQSQDLQIYLYT